MPPAPATPPFSVQAATAMRAGLKQILSGTSESARAVRAGLERRVIDLAKARAITLFGGESRAGDTARIHRVARWAVDRGCARLRRWRRGAQDTATPIRLHILRSRLRAPSEAPLPEPLADPLQDIRVNHSTAEAYFVRAGDYIQIIDVAGRQCTDFQCFSARKLDKGVEHAARRHDDAHADRAELSARPACPPRASIRNASRWSRWCRTPSAATMPSRLACNARYYDDMGYPGHVNCTENFNQALAPYGIAARKGWMALNYLLQHRHRRQQRALSRRAVVAAGRLCAAAGADRSRLRLLGLPRRHRRRPMAGTRPTSTSAPIPANEKFSRAVAYRMTPDAEPELTRETAFHPRFAGAHPQLRRVSRLLAADALQQRRADRRNTGPAASGRRSWTCRRCANSR